MTFKHTTHQPFPNVFHPLYARPLPPALFSRLCRRHRAADEQQILIVKCAWGGKSLVNEATTNLGTYFPDYEASGGYEIAGICWHQGFNDRVSAPFSAAYEVDMANFIRDIRSDLGVPGLPFVIATSAMDASPDVYTQVETAQL